MAKEKFKIVKVKFSIGYSDREYNYKSPEDLDITKGDYITVVTPHDVMPKTAVVTDSNVRHGSATKWIVGKIDMTEYNARLEKEKRIEELEKALEEKVKAVQKVKLYETLSDTDDEFKELLKEFKELT